MMKKIKYFILLFLAILSVENVRALSFDHFSVGYSYSQPNHNISDTWVTYSTSNNTKSLSQLPNQEEIFINEFSFRFGLNNNGFKSGSNYIITFDWANYDYADEFINYYDRMTHTLGCRVTNWNTTNQSADYCFTVNNVVASGDDQLITVTISFTPKIDFFGLTLTNKVNSNPEWPTSGWEVSTASYSVVSDGTQDIINNNNQNTQNIINNQNQNTQDITNALDGVLNGATQNTEDIINNQNQNAQDIQNTINDNFQTCRNSYNIFDYASSNYFENSSVIVTGTGDNFTVSSTGYGLRAYYIGLIDYPIIYKYLSSPFVNYSLALVVTNYNSYSSWADYASDRTILSSSWNSSSYNLSNHQGKYLWLQVRGANEGQGYTSVTYTDFILSKVPVSSYEAYGVPVCKNKMDETNDIVNNINDSINDTTPPDTDSLSNASGWLPPGPVDSILNLPLTLLQSLNNAFSSSSCQPISIDLPHISNRPLVIPCMSTVWEGFGLATFFTWIGRVLGGVLLYKYLIGLYKWVDDTLTMRENNNFDDGSLG